MYVSIKDFKLKLKEDGAVDNTVLLLIDIMMKWLKDVPFVSVLLFSHFEMFGTSLLM